MSKSIKNSIEDFLVYSASVGKSPKTIRRYRTTLSRLEAFLGSQNIFDPREVTKTHIEDFLLYLKERHRTRLGKSLTVRGYNAFAYDIRTYFKWLENTEQILCDPFESLPDVISRNYETIPYVLSEEDMIKFLEACPTNTPGGLRDRAILEMLYSTGIRCSELINLNLEHFLPDQKELVIVQGKGRKDRIVPIGEYACRFTEAYLQLVRPWHVVSETERALFLDTRRGHRINYMILKCLITRVKAYSGITGRVTLHTFRHSMATHMVRNKADIRHVQALLGHVSLKTTQIYTHVTIEDLKKMVKESHPHGSRKE